MSLALAAPELMRGRAALGHPCPPRHSSLLASRRGEGVAYLLPTDARSRHDESSQNTMPAVARNACRKTTGYVKVRKRLRAFTLCGSTNAIILFKHGKMDL